MPLSCKSRIAWRPVLFKMVHCLLGRKHKRFCDASHRWRLWPPITCSDYLQLEAFLSLIWESNSTEETFAILVWRNAWYTTTARYYKETDLQKYTTLINKTQNTNARRIRVFSTHEKNELEPTKKIIKK